MATHAECLTQPQIRAAMIVAMIDGADKGEVAKVADALGLRQSDSEPIGTAKHPAIAMVLASIGILIHAVKNAGKPLVINYRTGEVRVVDE